MAAWTGAATRRGDVSSRLEKGLNVTGPVGFNENLMGGWSYQQPHRGIDLSALQNLGRNRKIFQTPVGT
jgi:hypothetical protein